MVALSQPVPRPTAPEKAAAKANTLTAAVAAAPDFDAPPPGQGGNEKADRAPQLAKP